MQVRNGISAALTIPALLLLAISDGCGGGSLSIGGIPPPASAHVILAVEENHSYSH